MKRRMKKRKGSAIVLVLVVFVVLSGIALTVTSLTVSNNKMASKQRDMIQAFYLAEAGIALGTDAVLQPLPGLPINSDGSDPTLLTEFMRLQNSHPAITQTLKVDPTDPNKVIDLNIRACDEDGNDILAPIAEKDVWVQIDVTASITNGQGTSTISGLYRIMASNPAVVLRELQHP